VAVNSFVKHWDFKYFSDDLVELSVPVGWDARSQWKGSFFRLEG
jgi:hypothetical protein